jgi:hypothetical protein
LILSAKYGFLQPQDRIEGTYDISFTRPHDLFISIEELREQVRNMGEVDKIICLCPSIYATIVEQAFGLEIDMEYPLRGVGGWGAMHTWLKENTFP